MELIWTEPFDYKLLIHFNNYENTYGEGFFESNLNEYANDMASSGESKNFVMHNLVRYYGMEKLRKFIKLVSKIEGV